mgnify:CR=1 FL=1
MKTVRSFIYLICLIIMHSCMDADSPYQGSDMEYCLVQGHVTDQLGVPLEKIRIGIKSRNNDKLATTYYTSSNGSFQCELAIPEDNSQMAIEIIIEDIDGEENGGLFESKTDMITIFEEDYKKRPVIIDLPTYRLNHATASESSPQS